jgi:FkbM family methyltransferase
MHSVVYGFFGASFTIATAASLGIFLVRAWRRALDDAEERLLAFIVGSVLLSAIVFALCTAHLARKSVFLILGLLVSALAIRFGAPHSSEKLAHLPRVWKYIFIVVFGGITAVYIFQALATQPGPDAVTRQLSLVDQKHGFQPNDAVTLPKNFELLSLFAFAIGRHSAAALVNVALLAAFSLLVLSFGRRMGYPIVGIAAAILAYLSPLIHLDGGLAAILMALFYLLQPAIWSLLRFIVNWAQPHFAQLTRVPWPVWIVLVLFSLWLFSYTNRSATLSAYIWLEQKLVDHWPVERQKPAIEKLAPTLSRMGLLHPARIQTHPGVSFFLDPRDLVAVSILRGGDWQPEIWDSLSPNLPEGGVFLDVGAHIGYFSMRAAVRLGKSGRIVAFEPNPETLKLLSDNVAANHAENVIVEPIACTDREQMLTLYAAPSMNTGASSLARENADLSVDEPPRPYVVRGRTIDDVVRELNLSRVDAIKIDVEGAEVYVLRGAVNTLKRFHPKVVIEEVERQLASMQTTVQELVSIFKENGYTHSKQIGPTDWEWTAP